jgi:hypothetical protein
MDLDLTSGIFEENQRYFQIVVDSRLTTKVGLEVATVINDARNIALMKSWNRSNNSRFKDTWAFVRVYLHELEISKQVFGSIGKVGNLILSMGEVKWRDLDDESEGPEIFGFNGSFFNNRFAPHLYISVPTKSSECRSIVWQQGDGTVEYLLDGVCDLSEFPDLEALVKHAETASVFPSSEQNPTKKSLVN